METTDKELDDLGHVPISQEQADRMVQKIENFRMPLLRETRELKRVFPSHVWIPYRREEQALKNHCGQSFAKLAERGGLGPEEAVCVMRGVKYHQMSRDEVCDWFMRFGWFTD